MSAVEAISQYLLDHGWKYHQTMSLICTKTSGPYRVFITRWSDYDRIKIFDDHIVLQTNDFNEKIEYFDPELLDSLEQFVEEPERLHQKSLICLSNSTEVEF